MSPWCEHCQDHFDETHYVVPWQSSVDGTWYGGPDDPGGGEHGAGSEYGPYGELLAKEEAYDKLVRRLPKRIRQVLGLELNDRADVPMN